MQKSRVLARYMGKHLSLGYRKGAKYSLTLKKFGLIERFFQGYPAIHIQRTNRRQPSAYASQSAFEKNWQIIREF